MYSMQGLSYSSVERSHIHVLSLSYPPPFMCTYLLCASDEGQTGYISSSQVQTPLMQYVLVIIPPWGMSLIYKHEASCL